MNLGPIRKFFKPLFGSDHRELVVKFLYAIIVSVIVVNSLVLLFILLSGESLFGTTTLVLFSLLVVQFILLFMLRRGFVNSVAVVLVISAWVGMTYQAWRSDGIWDVTIFAYVLIILMSALLTNWRISLLVTLLSVAAIWMFAIAESRGLHVSHLDSPLHFARDLTAIFALLIFMIFLVINTLRQSLERTQAEFAGRSRAEQALLAGEEMFRKIFNLNPVAINVTSLKDGRLIDANDAYWKLTGFDRETSIGRTTVELKIWDDEEQYQQFVSKMLEQKSLRNPSYEFVDEMGEYRATIAFYELIDLGDQPTILSMFYDITEQRTAQLALQLSEERMRALLEAAPDMIFELKRDGMIVQFIPSVNDNPIMPPEEFIGKTITEVLPLVAEQTIFAIDRALESGQVNAFEYQLLIGEEAKTYEARITPAGPDVVLAMVRDVSLRNWAASERDKLIDELESKNAELERFTYTVSHDLKSPLITIMGFLGYVREDVQTGNMDRFETDLQRIGDATGKMQHLLGDLLDLSRIGRLTNKPEYIPMNGLIAEVLELLHGRIRSGNISVRVEEHLPLVYGDRQRLFEVLQNLIDNAAKFMGDQPAPSIEIGQQDELNDMPLFFVRDNGVGISPQYKDKIFGLFDKLNAQTEGTGIGLALVKRIVEYHGGEIWVESEAGQGATFFFTLPRGESRK